MALTRRVIGMLAVATLGTSALVAQPAQALDPDVLSPCHVASVVDPTAEADTQVGVLVGAALFPVGVSPRLGMLTCSMEINGNGTHTDASFPSITGPTSLLALVAGRAPISYHAAATDTYHLCSRIDFPNGGVSPYYWDSNKDEWSPDPTVPCARVVNLLVARVV